jgi:hypothetical protein
MITCHVPAFYVGNHKPLTAKTAKKQREERKEQQQPCFATSAPLFAIFAVKGLCKDHIKLRAAWPGIVAGEGLNLRLPIQPRAGQSMGF